MRTPRLTPAIRRRALLGGLVLPVLAVTGCGTDREQPAPTGPAQDLLVEHGLQGRDAREIIDQLEALPLAQRPTDLLVAVMPQELVLSGAAGREATLPLPEEEFYLSVAPYLEATHQCTFHSLTTCLGELSEREVEVLVTDADGEILVEEVRATAPNGFLGLWLPRDQELTLSLTLPREGSSASSAITTDEEALTCLTTMQLGT